MKLYLFGDSICFGQLVSSYKIWANSLATALEDLGTAETRYLVQNAGVNGNTTRQALERMHYDVSSHRPSYVLIQFGMNDCNYWETDRGQPRVSPAAFMANLQEIVRKCQATDVKHCFINTNHPTARGSFRHIQGKTYDQSNEEYNVYIRDVTQKMQAEGMPVTLFDIERSWRRYLLINPTIILKDLLLEDGIHLSDVGHRVYISTLVFEVVARIRAFEML